MGKLSISPGAAISLKNNSKMRITLYSASRHQITDVWVTGKQCLKNRELMTINIRDLHLRIAAWQEKLSK
jgi:hypothetical protein